MNSENEIILRANEKNARRCTLQHDLSQGKSVPNWTEIQKTKELSSFNRNFGYGVSSFGSLWRLSTKAGIYILYYLQTHPHIY